MTNHLTPDQIENADRARAALAAYNGTDEPQTNITDLMTDLAHLLDTFPTEDDDSRPNEWREPERDGEWALDRAMNDYLIESQEREEAAAAKAQEGSA